MFILLKRKKKDSGISLYAKHNKRHFFQVKKQRWGAVALGPLQHLSGLLSYPALHGLDRATAQRAFPLYRCHYKTLHGQSPVNYLQGSYLLYMF